MRTKNWSTEQIPSKKILELGASYLSDAELLAIFLRARKGKTDLVGNAQDLLSKLGGLRQVMEEAKVSPPVIEEFSAVVRAKMLAMEEIVTRNLGQVLREKGALTSPQLTQRYLTSKLQHEQSEVFSALLLDSQHRVIDYVELARGTIDSSAVYPREVAKTALIKNAAAVIFAHNHPSGIAEASRADKAITERLVKALGLFDIRVLDHIIVGDGEFTSFAEKGWL
jgi:DNA repair protein RadC